MASCSNYALSGLAKSCDPSKGGIRDIYVALYSSISAVTVDSGETITAITSGDSSYTWYHFNVRKGTASMTSTLNVDEANGINYVETTLNLQFNRMEAKKRLEMKALSLNELAVIVKDANGAYWFLGENTPVTANGGDSQTGQAVGDGNFYGITLVDQSDSYPKEVAFSAFSSDITEATA